MIRAMRRWLVLILVLLLPLRGLVGEAMAGEMLTRVTQQAQAQTEAQTRAEAQAQAQAWAQSETGGQKS